MPVYLKTLKPYLFTLIFMWSGLYTPALHRFYISITKIEPANSGQNMECTMKFFRDDFEQAIANLSKDELKIEMGVASGAVDSIIESYVKQHVWVQQNGKDIKVKYVGAEVEQDLIWVYAEFARPAKGLWQFGNSCLLELQAEQVNVVNLFWDKQSKSALLKAGEERADFEW
ncbi:hypothetical protein GC194_05970 [bacterium]|nr:hypothetical protein [bacterium]